MDRRQNRVAQACTFCRTHKTRCDGERPSCSTCIDRSVTCTYPAVQRRRGPGKSKEYIKSLEERLARMEDMLSTKHPSESDPELDRDHDQDISEESVDTNINNMMPGSSGGVAGPAAGPVPVPGPIGTGFTDTWAAEQSAFHFPDFGQVLSRVQNFDFDNAGVDGQQFFELPPLMGTPAPPAATGTAAAAAAAATTPAALGETELFLLAQVADRWFGEFPLTEKERFLADAKQLAHSPLSLPSSNRRVHECMVHATVAAAIPLKTANSAFRELTVYAWAFFKNAFGVFPSLLVTPGAHAAAAVKAVLSMALFARNWPATRMTLLLLSTAVRMMQVDAASSTPDPDLRPGTNVYCIAYLLDAELSLRCGIPPQLEPFSPVSAIAPSIMATTGRPTRILHHRAELAALQSRISKILCDQAPTAADDMPHLAQALERWRVQLPPELRPSTASFCSVPLEDPASLMHLAFYNAVLAAHWVARTAASKDNTNFLSRLRCREAARLTIQLVVGGSAPTQFIDLWHLLHFPITAALVLVADAVERPDASDASQNYTAVVSLVDFVGTWASRESCDLQAMLSGCTELANIARGALALAALGDNLSPRHEAFKRLMSNCINPMRLTQGLMGDLFGDESGAVNELSKLLGVSAQRRGGHRYGAFVPDQSCPETYGFTFDI